MILQPPRQVRPTPAVSDPAVRPDDVGGAVDGDAGAARLRRVVLSRQLDNLSLRRWEIGRNETR
jgi:hypothetical protein